MKKIIAITIAFLFIFTTGCGKKNTSMEKSDVSLQSINNFTSSETISSSTISAVQTSATSSLPSVQKLAAPNLNTSPKPIANSSLPIPYSSSFCPASSSNPSSSHPPVTGYLELEDPVFKEAFDKAIAEVLPNDDDITLQDIFDANIVNIAIFSTSQDDCTYVYILNPSKISILAIGKAPGLVNNLNGLEKITNLNFLRYAKSGITNATIFTKLTFIKELFIGSDVLINTLVNSVELSKLTNLESLSLQGIAVTGTSFLKELTNLKSLYLRYCPEVIKIPELRYLTNLKTLELHIMYNIEFDYSDIQYLTSLEELKLIFCHLEGKDLSFLKELTNLKILNLAGSYGYDIDAIKEMLPNTQIIEE